MKDLRSVILAAGKGTRMKSGVPKVLHKICGKPMIRYVLDVVDAVGSLKTYVVLGHKSAEVQQYLGKEYIPVEQKKLLGTADAIKTTERRLKTFRGDVLVLCGDTPLLNKNVIRLLVKKHKAAKAVCTFLTAVVHNPQGYGRIIRREDSRVVAIREDKDAVGFERTIAEINVGVYCFKAKELFAGLRQIKLNKKKKEFYLTDIIEHFTQEEKKVETVEAESPDECLGINTREDLAIAERCIQKRILRNLMLSGVTIQDPETTYISADAKIGKDSIIKPFSYIEEDVRIGEQCEIGPYARLRAGTRIGNHVEIGNFTEVNRTKIGNKTLVKHFSYLGDSFIGKGVNIGAGTVTANFDGKNKNVTRIGNDAFIGSDTVLVAPAKIGKNAKIGAGSIVTQGKSIPDGALAYGAPAQIISRRPKR